MKRIILTYLLVICASVFIVACANDQNIDISFNNIFLGMTLEDVKNVEENKELNILLDDKNDISYLIIDDLEINDIKFSGTYIFKQKILETMILTTSEYKDSFKLTQDYEKINQNICDVISESNYNDISENGQFYYRWNYRNNEKYYDLILQKNLQDIIVSFSFISEEEYNNREKTM